MKSTGIVRRIDELGRVVIPKELRKTLRLREGDPIEVYTEHDTLVFKKYSPLVNFIQVASGVCEALNEVSGKTVCVCDTDTVICTFGSSAKEYDGKKISEYLRQSFKQRKTLSINNTLDNEKNVEDRKAFLLLEGEIPEFTSVTAVPVILNGDLIGGVIMFSGKEERIEANDIRMVKLASCTIEKQLQ